MNSKFIVLFIVSILIFFNFNNISNAVVKNQSLDYFNYDGEYYALIAGCSEYKDKFNNLPKPPLKPFDDEKMLYIYESLISSKNWKKENIIVLLNEEATKKNITDTLQYFSGIITQNDIFLFQWCGHGSIIPDEDGDESFYDADDIYDEVICPYDMIWLNNTYQNFLTDDELDFYFSMIESKGMCLIFDSCLSGGLVSINDEYKNNIQDDFIWDLWFKKSGLTDIDGENRIIIMSTYSNYSSYASFSKGNILIYSLGASFNKPFLDDNNDGFISVEEAYQYAKPLHTIESVKPIISYWILNLFLIKMGFYKWVYYVPILKKIYNIPFIDRIMKFLYEDLNIFLSSTIDLIYSLIMAKIIFQYLFGVMIKNSANICDNFPGDLNLIEY